MVCQAQAAADNARSDTDLPLFLNRDHAPYFNTGSSINPGYLTGIEIQGGLLLAIELTTTACWRRSGR